ncbi:LysR family transcriptional regulator [Nocardioides marmoriginsengisoli]|uniref:LysR family transcriptional regulator n=1 Tax=Nocardioides marmoriginsengisoli TaxID=661483 RepID=A0A3N0CPH9_9ACTN|nr:LysR substrate-binding domain-containing protein [Nocardioides marmoriginsengisoli]RNL65201.1 LysR family transcriptional regulator [Nocardioides marmoriginsengisoli]
MNIQQLRYVVMTADRGSMTAAAAALYVAQPALSRAIRLLERELDVVLFARSGRGVVLTVDGEAFLVGARKVLRTLDELRGVGEATSRDAQLVIAATPTLQASMAVPILALLQQQGIAVPTRLIGAGDAREVHELVGTGRADLGICDQAIESDLVAVPLGVAEILLVSPPELEAPDPITVAQLSGLPLVLPTSGTDRRAAFDRFFEACGCVPEVAIESDERSVWLEAVLSGLASCIWHSVDSLRAPLREFSVRKFDPPMFQELSVVHRGADDAPAMLLLLDVIREFAALRASSAA